VTFTSVGRIELELNYKLKREIYKHTIYRKLEYRLLDIFERFSGHLKAS